MNRAYRHKIENALRHIEEQIHRRNLKKDDFRPCVLFFDVTVYQDMLILFPDVSHFCRFDASSNTHLCSFADESKDVIRAIANTIKLSYPDLRVFINF